MWVLWSVGLLSCPSSLPATCPEELILLPPHLGDPSCLLPRRLFVLRTNGFDFLDNPIQNEAHLLPKPASSLPSHLSEAPLARRPLQPDLTFTLAASLRSSIASSQHPPSHPGSASLASCTLVHSSSHHHSSGPGHCHFSFWPLHRPLVWPLHFILHSAVHTALQVGNVFHGFWLVAVKKSAVSLSRVPLRQIWLIF